VSPLVLREPFRLLPLLACGPTPRCSVFTILNRHFDFCRRLTSMRSMTSFQCYRSRSVANCVLRLWEASIELDKYSGNCDRARNSAVVRKEI
jgi:hypothetical protein